MTTGLEITVTYIDSEHPNTNYGTATTFKVSKGAAYECRGLVKHTWGPGWGEEGVGLWNASVIVAWLRFYIQTAPAEDIVLLVRGPLVAGWDEATVTWNNAPSLDPDYKELRVEIPAGTTGWVYVDIRDYLYLMRSWRVTEEIHPEYGYLLQLENTGSVEFRSDEYSDANYRPEMLYWSQTAHNVLLGGANRTTKLYGLPGSDYWLTYRILDADNRPGRWAPPVMVTLPSQGATPNAPSSAPTITGTNLENVKRITMTTSTPLDFSHYEVDIYDVTGGTHTYLQTTANILDHIFAAGQTNLSYQVRYRFVTRSGVTSGWSPYCAAFTIYRRLRLYRADQTEGGPYIEIDSDSHIRLFHPSGSSSITYDYEESQPWAVARKKSGDIPREADYSKVAATSWCNGSSTNQTIWWVTFWEALYYPPGSGNVALLLLITIQAWHSGANTVHKFRVMGDTTQLWYGEKQYGGGAQFTLAIPWLTTAGTTRDIYAQHLSSDANYNVNVSWAVGTLLDLGRY